jgi:hypothetical protein
MIPAEVCLRVGFGEHLASASKVFLEALDGWDTAKQAAGNDAICTSASNKVSHAHVGTTG